MSVKIIIKSATQSVDDFSLDCDLTWTIGSVKEKIAELYPNNPKKEHQKLIYGGKLLPDHLSLKSVLNHLQERHIVHLVCPFPTTDNTNDSKQAAPSQSFTVPPTNPAYVPLNQPILNPPSLSAVTGVVVTGDAVQQYLAMQQMYAQFMTHYLSQYNGGVPPVIPYTPAMTVPPVQTPQVPAPQQNLTPNRPQRQAENEDDDYLEYMYIISRALVMFALFIYYSSLSRVLIVVTMFLFISIYVKLNRQNQRQQQMQRTNERQQQNEITQSQQAPADIQAIANEDTAANPPTGETTSSENLSQQTEGRSIASVLSTTVSLISAFFSSLIPADPVPVNVN